MELEAHSLLVAGLEESNELLQEENSRLRNSNRILRTINSQLRKQLMIQHENDEQFKAFCSEPYLEAATEAVAQFGELWGSAEFDCGPEDYAWMVEQSIAAVRELKKIKADVDGN